MNYEQIYSIILNTKNIILSNVSNIDNKGKGDFVTNIDLQVNNYLKQELSAAYPEVDFFSEEETGKLTENCWILDPIDGTTNLVYGLNHSAVSLAHYLNGAIVFGIVFNPFRDEAFSALKGQGAYLNKSKKLNVSQRIFSESMIEFYSNPYNKSKAAQSFALGLELFQKALDIRASGSAALALCYVAAARVDGYVEELLKPWDYAAGSLILQEAGGQITDFKSKPLIFDNSSAVLATNKLIHNSLADIITKYYTE